MIQIKNLVKIYEDGFKAVDDVSLKIKKGEIFGIIGLSGAGKSSLLRCINRLEEATSGEIFVNGKNITLLDEKKLREVRKEMSMIFQSFNLFYQKDVFENIAFPLKVNGFKKDEINKRVMELLKFVNLEDKVHSFPKNLSGGQKQCVAIARALANNPKILLCDEATSALDPQSTKSILELLKKIRDEFNLTIVLITHQMEVVKEICDRAGVMENGKIVEENDVVTLFTKPKHKVTKSFIENLPIDVDYKEIKTTNYAGNFLRLGFSKESSTKPVLSELVRNMNIDVNIIGGNIDTVKEGKIGHLVVEIKDFEKLDNIKSFFEERKVFVEEIL